MKQDWSIIQQCCPRYICTESTGKAYFELCLPSLFGELIILTLAQMHKVELYFCIHLYGMSYVDWNLFCRLLIFCSQPSLSHETWICIKLSSFWLYVYAFGLGFAHLLFFSYFWDIDFCIEDRTWQRISILNFPNWNAGILRKPALSKVSSSFQNADSFPAALWQLVWSPVSPCLGPVVCAPVLFWDFGD